MPKISLQLYTVRRLLGENSIADTMQCIKDIGYSAVQLFGDVTLAERFAEAASAAGLEISGWLADRPALEGNEPDAFELCRRHGIPELGISAFHTSLSDARELIRWVNAFGRSAAERGIVFSYHNHSKEFTRTECGETVMQLYLEGFEECVVLMPDTYWLQAGGCDVRRFLEAAKGRVRTLHLKDARITPDGAMTFAEVGAGNLWWEGIFEKALECGAEWLAVEQDECGGSPLESIRMSYEFIKKAGM